jgi:hypothetical protein
VAHPTVKSSFLIVLQYCDFQVQRKIMKDATTKEDLHSDTAFSAGSLKAARRAAGAVQHAVDW